MNSQALSSSKAQTSENVKKIRPLAVIDGGGRTQSVHNRSSIFAKGTESGNL